MLRITRVAASVGINRGTPWNRLGRAAGVAPCKGGGEATRRARSLGVC
jgi:hypothetical protein